MADENRKVVRQESSTLTDDQIVTERKLPRRSFLTAAGTLLAGGAVAMVAVGRAAAQDSDAAKKDDKAGASDPDAKKTKSKSKKSKKSKTDTKQADPDSAKTK